MIRVKSITHAKWLRRKRRIAKRLRIRKFKARARPMLAAGNIHYEISDRDRAIACGGIGSIHLPARKVGLIEAIDRAAHLLKVHLPYHESDHESDHVLNIACHIMAGGECLQDIAWMSRFATALWWRQSAAQEQSEPDQTTHRVAGCPCAATSPPLAANGVGEYACLGISAPFPVNREPSNQPLQRPAGRARTSIATPPFQAT